MTNFGVDPTTKTVRLHHPRPERDLQVTIDKDDTWAMMLANARRIYPDVPNLYPKDVMALKPDGSEYMENDLVFPTVEDGGKIELIVSSKVGG